MKARLTGKLLSRFSGSGLLVLVIVLGFGFVAAVLIPGLQLASELAESTVALKFVGQQQRNRIVALLQPPQQIERGRSGVRAKDTIVLRIFAAKITLDGAEHIGIVVDRQ